MSLIAKDTTTRLEIKINLATENAVEVAKTKANTFISNQVSAGRVTADSKVHWETKTRFANQETPYHLHAKMELVLTAVSEFADLRSAVLNALSDFDNAEVLQFTFNERWVQEVPTE
jgi:hypothetical protein